ncbi:GspH/FimT family pseudopilin [Thiocystis violacea]|uniref:GspH/FimT family pseudopilin n=1 Tax=Thiocystis violacea TaxID=13725 RepID=UPI001F5B54ED|nr:GspH/FimT family pseudopilin [Thiocystis violacea]
MPPTGPRPAKGLTLLELIVAIAILALLLAVAVPSMGTMIARNRLKAAAHAVAEDLQWTRSEAIKRNRVLQFSLDLDHWCYGVDEPGALCDCRAPSGAARACSLKRVSGVDFPGVRLDATFTATRFEPRRATALNGSLALTSSQGSAIRVVLSRLGRVRLCTSSGDLPGYDSCGD